MRIVFFALGLSLVGCGAKSLPAQPDMALGTVDFATGLTSDDLAVTPNGCSTLQQDCSDPNQKCNLVVDNVKNVYAEACVDLMGTKALGETCMRAAAGNDGVGHDNCAKPLYCSDYGSNNPTNPDRHCRKFCSKNSDCAQKEACLSLMGIQVGTCAPTCTPFGSDCSNGLNCSDALGDVNQKYAYLCRTPGTGKEGAECTVGCVQDTVCLLSVNMKSYCYKLCNGQHPCQSGTCKAIAGDVNNGTVCQQ